MVRIPIRDRLRRRAAASLSIIATTPAGTHSGTGGGRAGTPPRTGPRLRRTQFESPSHSSWYVIRSAMESRVTLTRTLSAMSTKTVCSSKLAIRP